MESSFSIPAVSYHILIFLSEFTISCRKQVIDPQVQQAKGQYRMKSSPVF